MAFTGKSFQRQRNELAYEDRQVKLSKAASYMQLFIKVHTHIRFVGDAASPAWRLFRTVTATEQSNCY